MRTSPNCGTDVEEFSIGRARWFIIAWNDSGHSRAVSRIGCSELAEVSPPTVGSSNVIGFFISAYRVEAST